MHARLHTGDEHAQKLAQQLVVCKRNLHMAYLAVMSALLEDVPFATLSLFLAKAMDPCRYAL